MPCLFSSVLIPAHVSWINPLPCRLDSVRTSFGLLLVYLDYLSALPYWILFADRRPTLAIGLLSALSVSYLFADVFVPASFVTMSMNKSLQMDLHASRLVVPVTGRGLHVFVFFRGGRGDLCFQLFVLSNKMLHNVLCMFIYGLFFTSRMGCCTRTVRAVSNNCLHADGVRGYPRALLITKMM